MSVASPILALLQSVGAVCAGPAAAPGAGFGGGEGAGEVPALPVEVQAETRSVALIRSVTPRRRLRILPPPSGVRNLEWGTVPAAIKRAVSRGLTRIVVEQPSSKQAVIADMIATSSGGPPCSSSTSCGARRTSPSASSYRPSPPLR